ncbi:nucleotidyltransferase family protein [Rathayibacter soli]|uniref:nucleotidyltransferase family protein n=1 Tax=Rathayibacter soli TaxID=3144168 RepID=UPI0027E4A8D3|nr:nucleotidyltransferase family protein [Glaciibacter superstes]
MTDAIGLLLAAGAGRRMGLPKALVEGADGLPWAVSAARTLSNGGCAEVVIVIGAAAPAVRALLADEPVTIVEASDWEEGMGASLRAALGAIATRHAAAALVHLVDLPDVGAEVIRRVLSHAEPGVLARASYRAGGKTGAKAGAKIGARARGGAGDPARGHPVLLGRDHWAAIAAECSGDHGARAYLARHDVLEVDCSDLAGGADVDTRADDDVDARSPILPKLGQ